MFQFLVSNVLGVFSSGFVFSWGDGDFGKLGRGGSEGCNVPQNIERLNGQGVCQIECGAQFSLALTKSGVVWTWWDECVPRLVYHSLSVLRLSLTVNCFQTGAKAIISGWATAPTSMCGSPRWWRDWGAKRLSTLLSERCTVWLSQTQDRFVLTSTNGVRNQSTPFKVWSFSAVALLQMWVCVPTARPDLLSS